MSSFFLHTNNKQIFYFHFNNKVFKCKFYPLKVKFPFHISKFQHPSLQLVSCVNTAEEPKQDHFLVLEITSLKGNKPEPGPKGMMRSPS